MLLSLVIPCYNESSRIDLMLQGLAEFEEKWKGDYEVIIVDDGSKDDTATKAQQAIDSKYAALKQKVKIHRLDVNAGKGGALKKGVSLAEGDYILTLDADMSTRPTELLNWLKRDKNLFVGHNTIYIGARKHDEGNVTALKSRKLIGGIFNGIVQAFTSLQLKDTQCGFKLYPQKAAKMLFEKLQSRGWEHDVELLYTADLNKLSIVEMPINWVNQPESKVNIFKDSIMMLLGVLSISFRVTQQAPPEQRNPIIYRALFNILAAALLIAMPLMSFQFAITGDEHWHFDYGNSIWGYFFSGDTSAQTATSGIQYYGGIFDFLTTLLFHLTGADHYTTMHFVNAFVGAIGIIYAGKLAKFLGGWNTGLLTMLLLIFSPSWFGHNFANPKDIPFSVGYTAGLYFILLFLDALPNPKPKHVIGLICSIGWAMGVRIGGLLLIGYLVMFIGIFSMFTGQLKAVIKFSIVKQIVIIGAAGYLIAIIFWPYAHLGIISKPMETLKVMSNFFVNIGMLYEGKKILSNQVPWYYIPKYILYTAPLVVLAGFVISSLNLAVVFKHKKRMLLYSLFILFSIIFPVFYAIYKKSSLYDGWRHFLFVYPPLVVLAAIGWTSLLKVKNAGMRFGTIAIIAFGIFLPAKFAIAYHPFESLYYNEIAGGLKSMYGKYETDYYMLGIKPASDWLVKNEHLESKNVIVATNCTFPLQAYYLDRKNISIAYVRYYERYAKDWDYCIVFSRFVDGSQLTTNNWPPKETIHTIDVDGVPVAAIMKRKTKKDFAGFELMKAKKIPEAKAMFLASLQEYPENDLVWEAMVEIYASEGNADSAMYAANKNLQYYPGNVNLYQMMGNIYLKTQKPDSAIKLYNNLAKYNPGYAHFFLAYTYATMGNAPMAFNEIDAAIAADPYNGQAYKLGMQIAQQTKNASKLDEYGEKERLAFPEPEEK